jgi:hypothetical protein
MLNKLNFIKKLYISALISIGVSLTAQTIIVGESNWDISTPLGNLPAITEAGNNYTGTYQSVTNQITINGELPKSFLSLLSSGSAKISMHYTPTSWHNSLLLYAKRNGGTASISGLCVLCSASVSGGDSAYIQIPQTGDATFFNINFSGTLGLGTTTLSYSDVNVQLQIGGVSVVVPAATYSAQIVFTISAN